jgi:hypothetical protein
MSMLLQFLLLLLCSSNAVKTALFDPYKAQTVQQIGLQDGVNTCVFSINASFFAPDRL